MERNYLLERRREAATALATTREMAHYWDRRYASFMGTSLQLRPWFGWGDPPAGFEAADWVDVPPAPSNVRCSQQFYRGFSHFQ
jgi:hypothetical protein